MAKALRSQKAEKEVEVKEVETSETKEKETKVEEVQVQVQVQEVKAEPKGKAKAEANVRVKPNQDIRTYIGDSWYNLKKGKQETVPQTVKDILARAGLLDPL